MESYTFLYVPYNPLDILVNCYTFLYVPYTFRIRSPHKVKDFDGKLYVPIRSIQPSRYSHELPHTFVHVPYTFVHIPCNSSTKSVKWDKALQLPQGLSSCAWIPTPVLMWPSCFRSYTFRYTFLYVPGGLLTSLFMVT